MDTKQQRLSKEQYAQRTIVHSKRFCLKDDLHLAAFVLRDIAINDDKLPCSDLLWALAQDSVVSQGDIDFAIELVEKHYSLGKDE